MKKLLTVMIMILLTSGAFAQMTTLEKTDEVLGEFLSMWDTSSHISPDDEPKTPLIDNNVLASGAYLIASYPNLELLPLIYPELLAVLELPPATQSVRIGYSISNSKPLLDLKSNENDTWVTFASEKFMRDPAIRKAICKYYGHRWEDEPQITSCNAIGYIIGPDAIKLPDEIRRCSICGKRQIKRHVSEWKDVK